MSVVLGINAYHAGASAALVVDGEPVVAVAEERLNRVKYYAAFPGLAVRQCLETAGLGIEDVDAVAVGRDPGANRGAKVKYALRHPWRLPNYLKILGRRSDLSDLKPVFATELDVPLERLRFRQVNVEHHIGHIASAYLVSGWDEAAGISIDGSGDFVTCMLASCRGDDIRVLQRTFVPHSLGTLYTMICEFVGYDRYGDEGKVMGLAPLGENRYREIFEDMVDLTSSGFRLNLSYFQTMGADAGMRVGENGQIVLGRHYSDRMVELFGEPRRRGDEITQRDKDLARGLQDIFERAYLHMLKVLHREVPLERVCLAGGAALNSVANGKIFEETPFRETFIQPAAGDDGLAIGAAMYVARRDFGDAKSYVMNDAYLGPGFDDDEMERALEALGDDATLERIDDRATLVEATVDELENGKVVGWYQGRMEWGPRALGARSILAHPGFPNMKDILNSRIKHREPFRPFAPAVLVDRQGDIFERSEPSPFMLHVYTIKPEWRDRLSAVTHVDDTGRLQSVDRSENALYYDLIAAFGERTGIPVLLNTSFNENEPIVNLPEEAVDCFLRTRMDVLVMGPFLCRKAGTGEDGAGASGSAPAGG